MRKSDPNVAANATVCLLDALGGRCLDLVRAAEWLHRSRTILSQVRSPLLSDVVSKAAKHSSAIRPPVLRMFGDTVLLIWKDEGNPGASFLLASWVAQQIVVGFMSHEIPVRGAIATGELAWNDESALGPALSAAAGWYERVDWLGVIAVDRCEEALDTLVRESGPEWMSNWYVRHPVVDKTSGDTNGAWALTWPQEVPISAHNRGLDPATHIDHLLSAIERQPTHEPKYARAREFYDEYMRSWAKHSLHMREVFSDE